MKVTLLKVTDGYDELIRDCIAANTDHRCKFQLNDDRCLIGNLFEVEKFQLNLEPRVVNYEQVSRDWGTRMRRDRDRRGTIWTETCRVVKELYDETGVAVRKMTSLYLNTRVVQWLRCSHRPYTLMEWFLCS